MSSLEPVPGVIAKREPSDYHYDPEANEPPALRKLWTRIRWLFVLNIALAIGSAGQAYFAYRGNELTRAGLTETRKATDNAERTARIDQRAWLSPAFRLDKDPNNKFPFVIAVPTDNRGKTPALKVRFKNLIGVAKSEPTIPESRWDKEVWQEVGVLFPSEANRLLRLGGLPPADLQRYLAGEELFLFIRMHYCDVFGREHWVHTCSHRKADRADALLSICWSRIDTSDVNQPQGQYCQP